VDQRRFEMHLQVQAGGGQARRERHHVVDGGAGQVAHEVEAHAAEAGRGQPRELGIGDVGRTSATPR
jgi:hypothetical protein